MRKVEGKRRKVRGGKLEVGGCWERWRGEAGGWRKKKVEVEVKVEGFRLNLSLNLTLPEAEVTL
jgi:hypothetical protein